MRIVFDLQACQAIQRQRGIGRYSMALAQAMARQGSQHEIFIALNNRFADTIDPIRAAFEDWVAPENIRVFDVPAAVAQQHSQHLWRSLAAERIREMWLARLAPDWVHVASLFEGWVDDAVTSVGQLNAGFNTAVTLYDLIPLLRYETYLANPGMRQWYYRKLQSLKNAPLLLAISQHTRQEAIAALHLPPQRVVNISAAVDAMFQPSPLSLEHRTELRQRYGLSRPFAMYTGGIDARKNIEGLIAAFGMLPESDRTTHQLAIVCQIGDSDKKRLQTLAAKIGLTGDAVVFTGFVPDADLVALYNLCTLFVFPSLHEGFGLPVLEAMACGAAVIGANTSSIPEVIGRDDALFDPTDVSAIAAKMQRGLTDRDFRDSLQRHALIQAQQFSWEASARTAWQTLEQWHREKPSAAPTRCQRPRLAYVSPLPPAQSGIADYSAELLPELARHYDIDVIVDQKQIEHDWISANFPQRTPQWFCEHARQYDRIVYHFGNSSFHQHMVELLERHPGVVVLHDFFLSGLFNYLEGTHYRPGAFRTALYQSHGYLALVDEKELGAQAACWKYPCNKTLLDRATGIIAHSHFSAQLAQTWYGTPTDPTWRIVPLLHPLPATVPRQAARQRLGLAENDFVVCSFGVLGPTKLNDRLLDAWLASPLAQEAHCHLVFVGENDPNAYSKQLSETIAAAAPCRIRITGFAAPDRYRDYLAAADAAVQLRTLSRGESSRSILDCLAYGIPTVINAHGAAADMPDDALIKLTDEFSQNDLSQALCRLWRDPALRENLSHHAVAYVQREHQPAHMGQRYFDAIEHFAHQGEGAAYRNLIQALTTLPTSVKPDANDLAAVAACIAKNRSSQPMRQLLVDISELVQRDAKSGIQRVVRNVLHELLQDTTSPYRVEPVYDAGGYYAYARNFTCGMLGVTELLLPDDPIEVRRGDRFLGLDLAPHSVPNNRPLFADLKNLGVEIYFVVYDLLPILRPDVFVKNAHVGFGRWLDAVTSMADGVICISRAVAQELTDWAQHSQPQRHTRLKIGYFHLGADIAQDISRTSQKTGAPNAPPALQAHPALLMVGTLEPRKGHAQALAAFEALWQDKINVNLIIVGKQGWMVEKLVAQLRSHPESGRRLFWFESASDHLLQELYATSSALLAASEAEGFGLPLIEAAQHRLPIIARDLPVFREVAGEHAFYFKGTDAADLAQALREWLDQHACGTIPSSEGLRWLTWAQSTQQLLNAVEQPAWYGT